MAIRWTSIPSLSVDSLSFTHGLADIVDVAIVAYLIYRFFLFIRGTRAVQLVTGIIVLFAVTALATRLRLATTSWLLKNTEVALVVALPIVFQPELRRALEQVGQGRFFAPRLLELGPEGVSHLIEELLRAIRVLARQRIGALIVVERGTGLADIAETGIAIDGAVSHEFLVNIFIPNTPLHDGAVIVRGNRVLAAACFLPLAESNAVGADYGTRHRAAMGVTEHSDAVALVVSEETGAISLAQGGRLIRNLDEQTLKTMLEELLPAQEPSFAWNVLHPRGRGRG